MTSAAVIFMVTSEEVPPYFLTASVALVAVWSWQHFGLGALLPLVQQQGCSEESAAQRVLGAGMPHDEAALAADLKELGYDG